MDLMNTKIPLSSDFTSLHKVFGIIIYPWVFFALTSLLFIIKGESLIFYTLFYCIVATGCFFLYRFLWLSCDAYIDDEFLYVTQIFKTDKINLDQIEYVKYDSKYFYSTFSEPTIRIRFKNKTKVGYTILISPRHAEDPSFASGLSLNLIHLIRLKVSQVKNKNIA
jgi:hypothetical protein